MLHQPSCTDNLANPKRPAFDAQVDEICRHEDRRQGDRKLIALCRRAEPVLVEDERRECFLSTLSDAVMIFEKSTRPINGEGSLTGYVVKVQAEKRAELAAARRAAKAGTKRSRKIITEIANLSATTAAGLTAKCSVMKAVIDTGYGHHDEFDDLAKSIYLDGSQLNKTASKPPVQHRQDGPHLRRSTCDPVEIK